MARKTSIKVFQQIKDEGLLSKRRWQVYSILFESGPLTGAQVAETTKKVYGAWAHSETIRNRLTELRDCGCVAEVGEVDCPISGRRVIHWDVTSSLPRRDQPGSKREKIRRQISSYRKKIRALDRVLERMDSSEKLKDTAQIDLLDYIEGKV